MSELASKSELLRSLGKLVRGLSALFWGLPINLLVCAQTDALTWSKPHYFYLPLLTNGLLFYGLVQLGSFQRQERVWMRALDRAKLLGLANLGLAPFLFFWNMLPNNPYFALAVGVLIFSGLFFLLNLNLVLHRLSAMLPDEMLREETRLFTTMNRYLLIMVAVLLAVYIAILRMDFLPPRAHHVLAVLDQSRNVLFVFLVLLPVSLTLTLIWKIKETVFQSVFNVGESEG